MSLTQVVHDSSLNNFRAWVSGVDPPAVGSGTGASYTYTQGSPASIWSIPHGLNTKALDIVIFDSTGLRIYADPDYAGASSNSIAVNFAVPVAGVAYVRSL
jgi:hypothetical protein